MTGYQCGIMDLLTLVGVLALAFACLCAMADYAIPRWIGIQRRRHHPNRIRSPFEDWK